MDFSISHQDKAKDEIQAGKGEWLVVLASVLSLVGVGIPGVFPGGLLPGTGE